MVIIMYEFMFIIIYVTFLLHFCNQQIFMQHF